jgi:hypothetical protein
MTCGSLEALGDGMFVRTVAAVEEEHPYLTFDLRVLENRPVVSLPSDGSDGCKRAVGRSNQ